jgi:2-oxoglutaroyl-CoA hydrolase
MASEHVLVERMEDRPVAWITLSRPEKHNTISWEMREDIDKIISSLGLDRDLRVIVLTGANGVFSSGGDLAGFLDHEPVEFAHLGENLAAPERCPKPVIAAIDGYCFGAGLELALTCDIRICTTGAQFALPELTRGQMPGSGGSQRLPRLIGWSRAKEMILRGRRMTSAEAFACGLVCEVVEPADLRSAALRIADELTERSPLALAVLKSTLNHGMDTNLSAGLEIERKAYAMLRSSNDYVEGVNAFLQKRSPKFKGK